MSDEYARLIEDVGAGVPNASQYVQLANLVVATPSSAALLELDPFSPEYRQAAFDLYLTMRGGEGIDYRPERDEAAPAALPDNLFTGVVPWNFRDPALVSEFLLSWGHMLRVLDLPRDKPLSILEYGPGSGQLLLILARLGHDACGVDINADAVATIRAQAEQMGLAVRTEQARFGEGFEGERFDRILFFEAFHHAFDFTDLLGRLRGRLKPGGKLVLCGEPVVPEPSSSIPYPWGPRLDGLSAFCIRRYGWMELGFTWPFLREAMQRAGWRVHTRPMSECGRADCYVAVPAPTVAAGEPWLLGCGQAGSDDSLQGAGWSTPEGPHRWTIGPDAWVLLPHHAGAALAVEIEVVNHLPVAKPVTVRCGDQEATVTVAAGTPHQVIRLHRCTAARVQVDVPLHSPADLVPGDGDRRMLGIAVQAVRATLLPA